MSLRTRIAATILLLELILLAVVLWSTLSFSLNATRAQMAENESVVLELLGELARRAFLTGEYAELQPFLGDVRGGPQVVRVLVADTASRVVSSSDPLDLGASLPALVDQGDEHWRELEVRNAAGPMGTVAVLFSSAPVAHAYARARNLGIAVAALGMAVVALAGMGMGSLLTRRLRRLADASDRFAEGEWSARARVSGSDEVAQVARAFDDMAVRIEAQVGALQRSERRYQDLLDRVGDLFQQVGPDGRLLLVNRAWIETLGYDAAQRERLRFPDLVRDDQRPRAEELLATAATEQAPRRVEFELRAADGRDVPVEGVFTGLVEPDAPPSTLAVLRDLTEARRAQAELRAKEAQLRQAQKLQDLGRLAGGIAHDFNNLLTVLIGDCQILAKTLAPDSPDRELVGDMRIAAERAADLVRQLLAFARRQVSDPVVVELNATVMQAKRLLDRLLGAHVELQLGLDPDVGWVRADEAQLQQVIVNLVVNARDAMPEGGTVRVETTRAAPGKGSGRNGAWTCLAVSDTGAGMDLETQEHMFDPFFSTKEPGHGTGLGLATVYGVVTQAGGKLEVRSAPGAGTTIRVYLPCAEATQAPRAAERTSEATHEGSETLLLVEDDRAVRRVVARMLREAGYRVIESAAPAAALESAPSLERIDLVVSDVVMPHMSGFELARRLLALRPGLRFLYISGYAVDEHTGARPPDGAAFLAKPFTQDELVARVRQLLDRPRPGLR